MTTNSNSSDRMPSERDIIGHAIRAKKSLTDAVKELAPVGANQRNLRRKAQRFVRKHVMGQAALDLLFKRGSRSDLKLASRFVCDPEDVTDLVFEGNVPVADACRGLPGERKLYTVLYNRISRSHGKQAPKQLKQKERQPPSNFFKVPKDELGHAS